MSSDRSSRSSQSQPRAIDQTDIKTLVPERLADLDYSIFDQLTVFEHRGHKCNVESLISYLGAAISNTAVEEGEESTPSTLSEVDTVLYLIKTLRQKYPAWFGDDDVLAGLERSTSGHHLSVGGLEEAYFDGETNPTVSPVDGDSWTDHKRLILPLTAILLHRVREQMDADSQNATTDAQQTIKETILREHHEASLSETEIMVAVDAALQELDDLYLRDRR